MIAPRGFPTLLGTSEFVLILSLDNTSSSMHRAFGRFGQFLRPVSSLPRTTLGSPLIPRWNSTMTAVNGANGGDSRPVFFFDIDNCVRLK